MKLVLSHRFIEYWINMHPLTPLSPQPWKVSLILLYLSPIVALNIIYYVLERRLELSEIRCASRCVQQYKQMYEFWHANTEDWIVWLKWNRPFDPKTAINSPPWTSSETSFKTTPTEPLPTTFSSQVDASICLQEYSIIRHWVQSH